MAKKKHGGWHQDWEQFTGAAGEQNKSNVENEGKRKVVKDFDIQGRKDQTFVVFGSYGRFEMIRVQGHYVVF